RDAIASRQGFDRALAEAGGWSGLADAAAATLSVSPQTTEEKARAALAAAIDRDLMARAREVFAGGKKTAKELSDGPLSALAAANQEASLIDAAAEFFLTKSGGPRARLGDAETKKTDPILNDLLITAQERFLAGKAELEATQAYLDTRAYYAAVERCRAAYQQRKTARAALDFDDLLTATQALFARPEDNAWVMYKLDSGLEHILLDEAQDTSPAQWDIIEAPLQEMIAGEGAKDRKRTFFAVGDQKQSIYSFQGADAGLFEAKKVDLGAKLAAADPDFKNVTLDLSFRTTEPVLRFVDALFAEDAAIEGVSAERPMRHIARRAGDAGRVELWPLTPHPEKSETTAWDAPLDMKTREHPVVRLCDEIAARVKRWITGKEPLPSQGRPIEPGDVMILVQSRGAPFHQMIASLSRAGVPVAGADKLKLFADPAVEDLMSYARFVLSLTDDLSLAEILKSPFFNVNDAALFDLAYGRKDSLWAALTARAAEDEKLAAIVNAINGAQRRALR
ncbi:MAG: UvrD-helicase domain-containing protein, partial [Pseudomonadota bacterium]